MPDIKGSAVRESIARTAERDGEEYKRVLARLAPATRQLFLDPISPNDWFPLDAFTRYLEAVVVEGGLSPEALIGRSEAVIERQLSGIYRVFAMLISAGSLVAKITAVNTTYFRGVEIVRTPKGNHGAVIRYVGFEPQHHLMEFIILGFYRKALELCGAQIVRAEWSNPISRAAGFAELALSWE